MASQPPAGNSVFEIECFVTGYHAYMDIWQPRIGEVLTLQNEPHNPKDKLAVAVMKSGSIIGNVPYNLAPMHHITFFEEAACSTKERLKSSATK